GAAGTGGAGSADLPPRPPTLLAGPPEELPTRLAIGARLCNLTIPSARGPERALHVGGANVRALFPVAPLHDEHALTLSTLSYGRHLHVTAAVDAAAIGGAGRLPVMLADAAEELGISTGARGSRGLP
ncbi:WS/DGAT domain-containing protein, partial [Conexibacter stalactiti]